MPDEARTEEWLTTIRWQAGRGLDVRAFAVRELLTEVDRLRSSLSEVTAERDGLIESLPHCQCKPFGSCKNKATMGTLSHEPEFCDEHAPSRCFRECDWAEFIRARKAPPP